VGLFDRLKPKPRPPETWHVYLDGSDLVADNGSASFRVQRTRARAVRVVPLSGGNPHAPGGGYQVAIACADGDVPIGRATPDWRAAQALGRQLCDTGELQLDEVTARLFSRVGTFS
jgi:hypothetical protein